MGVYLCTDPNQIYDIQTGSQGIVFICMAFLFLVSEISYIMQSIKLFKAQNEIRQVPTLIIFYISMHILFIRTIFYSLGGVIICYNEQWYIVLTSYMYILKRLIFSVIVYRIAVILRYLSEFYVPRTAALEKGVLIFCSIDFVFYNAAYAYLMCFGKSVVILIYYDFIIDIVLAVIFAYSVLRMNKCMKKILKSIGEFKEISKWKILIWIMAATFIIRILNEILTIMIEDEYIGLDFIFQFWWALYIVFYLIFTEICPCVAMIWIISKSISSKQIYVNKSLSTPLQKPPNLSNSSR